MRRQGDETTEQRVQKTMKTTFQAVQGCVMTNALQGLSLQKYQSAIRFINHGVKENDNKEKKAI